MNRRSLMRLAICALAAMAVLPQPARAAAKEPVDAEDRKGFREIVSPFLKRHCVKCHGPDKQEGGLNLRDIEGDVSVGGNLTAWKAVAERLTLNEMPPWPEPRPDVKSLIAVQNWIKVELARRGESISDVEQRLLLPGQGNRVDHEALFSGEITEPSASPSRLWRISPQLYSSFVPRISGLRLDLHRGNGTQVGQPFSENSGEGFKDYASLFAIDEPTVVQLMNNALLAVERQAAVSKVIQPLIHAGAEPRLDDMQTAIRRQFQLVLLRDPTDAELERFVQLMRKNIADSGPAIGARQTLATVLMLPEVLYRIELGQGAPDRFGRRMLSPRELSYAISFALTDDPPDRALREAAEQGRLDTRDDVQREVQRLLSDTSIDQPRIMRFFEEYFEFTTASDVFKDFDPPLLKKSWQPAVLVNDTRRLVQYILDEDRDVLRELLTTNKSFVNYAMGPEGLPAPAWRNPKNTKKKLDGLEEIHYWYNLPSDWIWTARQPIELPSDERAGILTQPSWQAAFATNNENHAIRRGKWIRERLLGGVVPDLPLGVDARLSDDPGMTLRQRMAKTEQEYCWQCHQMMNPLGLPFESYDYLGRFRTSEIDQPVDTTGHIDRSGDVRLDGDVVNAVELMHKLANSPRVRQVFVRHAFRYWMGRNETLEDSPTLIAADKGYVESGGSMKALILSLLTSDAFLYRQRHDLADSVDPP